MPHPNVFWAYRFLGVKYWIVQWYSKTSNGCSWVSKNIWCSMRLGKDIWVPFKRYQNTSGRGADVETSPLTFCRDGQVTANLILYNNTFPANIYLFKVNNKNTSKRCRICSNSTTNTPERRQRNVCWVTETKTQTVTSNIVWYYHCFDNIVCSPFAS